MKWEQSLKIWREERGLTSYQDNYINMMKEEIQEYIDAEKDVLESLDYIEGSDEDYPLKPEELQALTWENQVDAICDQIVLTVNAIEQLKHQIKSMIPSANSGMTKETLLSNVNDSSSPELKTAFLNELLRQLKIELSDHNVVIDLAMKQCLKEISSRSGSINDETGKWEKYTTPEAKKKWYKANYKLCKKKNI